MKTQMDVQAVDRLLDALGEGMAARMPALEVAAAPDAATHAAPATPGRRAVALRRARAAALALAPLPVLALLFGTDAVGFLPVYAAMLLIANVRDALRTALSWALAWSTAALGTLAFVPGMQPEAASFVGSAGPLSILVGVAAFLTGGLLVTGLAAFRRSRDRSDLPLAQAAWWGAGAGSIAASAALIGAFVLGLPVASWFVPGVFLGLAALGAGSAVAQTRFDRLLAEGRDGPARLRGTVGISLAWGLGYGLIGLAFGVPLWIFVGLVSGAAFSALHRRVERRGLLTELSPARLAVVGGVGAAISAVVALPLHLVLARGGLGVVLFLVLVALLGAGAAAVTVVVARMMEEDAPDVAYDDEDARWLREGIGLLED